MSADKGCSVFVLLYGSPSDGDTCAGCKGELAPAYVSLGRPDGGRLCPSCAEPAGLQDLVDGLERLDDYVVLAEPGSKRLAALLNVQEGLRRLTEARWAPLLGGGEPVR